MPDPQKPVTQADFDAAKPIASPTQSDWDAAKPVDAGSPVEDLLIGAAKGVGNTVTGLGELVHKIPGVSDAIDAFYGTPGLSKAAFSAAREATKPTNAAQKVGQTAEQIGEFFTPTGAAGKIGKLAEIAKAAGLTMAQGGGAGDAAVSAGLTAAVPGGSALKKASGALESSAEKSMAQALGATKEAMKVEAMDLAPEMLKRGIGGTRQAMLDQASAKVEQVGQQLGQAYTEAAKRGDMILGAPVLSALENAAKSLQVSDAKGVMRAIPGTQEAIKQLQELHSFTASLGDAIPIDKAAYIRRTLDQIVDKAGLFGNKATASATDASKAWSTREAANAFRGLINSRDANIADLNKEFTFWKGLQDVLGETQKRTQAQGPGLGSMIAGAAGGGAGFVGGGLTGAALGAYGSQQLAQFMQSPLFRSKVSAPLKNMLADALASGNATRITATLKTIFAATPAQVDKQ